MGETIATVSYIKNNMKLGRGCRQPDPVSLHLLILTAEFLAEAIRPNKYVEGIKIIEGEHKISQHADDTTLFLNQMKSTYGKVCQI